MAARINPYPNERVREIIQTTQLLKRLQELAVGDAKHDKTTKDRIRCIEILLRKVIPDLKAIEHSGEQSFNVTQIEQILVEPNETSN